MSHLSKAGPGIRGIQRTMEEKDDRIEELESQLRIRDEKIGLMVKSLRVWHDSLGWECSAKSEGMECCIDKLLEILDPPDPNEQVCIVCGTRWTAPVAECPSPWLHGDGELVISRDQYPKLYDSIEHAYSDATGEEFTVPPLLPKVAFDVVGESPNKDFPNNPYKTRLVGCYWETGFCQNCQKVRYNTDNNHGLCGWCAEQLYPAALEE